MTEQELLDEEELEARRWKHRRRIAYMSLYFGMFLLVVAVGLALVSNQFAERLEAIMALLSTGTFALFTLTGAYMGLSSMGKSR